MAQNAGSNAGNACVQFQESLNGTLARSIQASMLAESHEISMWLIKA
jgi:hypothetical protein